MTAPREDGFYWVKRNGKWEVAAWTDGSWDLTTTDMWYADTDMEEIGPRLTPPDHAA